MPHNTGWVGPISAHRTWGAYCQASIGPPHFRSARRPESVGRRPRSQLRWLRTPQSIMSSAIQAEYTAGDPALGLLDGAEQVAPAEWNLRTAPGGHPQVSSSAAMYCQSSCERWGP